MRAGRLSVLVVDDHEVDRYLLQRRLNRVEPAPYVFEVENGEQALAFFTDRLWEQEQGEVVEGFQVSPPELVVLDINMPRMNGLEFLDEFAVVRAASTDIAPQVIMYSTADIEHEQQRALAHDFVAGYYTKGSFDDEVIASIFLGLTARSTPMGVSSTSQLV